MPSLSQSLPHHQLSSHHQASTGAKESPSHQIRLPQASRQLRSSAIAGPGKATNAVTAMASTARINWMRLIKYTSFVLQPTSMDYLANRWSAQKTTPPFGTSARHTE